MADKHHETVQDLFAHYSEVLGAAQEQPAQPVTTESDVAAEIAQRREELRNKDLEQDIELKRKVLNRLFRFLVFETIGVFVFAFFQAIHWPFNFQLDGASFNILTTATIIQIAGMLLVAVRYLFPTKKES